MVTKSGGHAPGSSARCDQCKRRRKKCDLSTPQCKRCEQSGLRCSGPRLSAVFVHRYADSFQAETQRAVLINAYKGSQATTRYSTQFFDTTILWIRYLQSLIAEHQWRTSLTVNENIRLSQHTSSTSVYQALLTEFSPINSRIFSGDRVETKNIRHYSSIATCIRALLPLSSLRILALDYSILSLLSMYYGYLHGEPGLQELAYSNYALALGQYSDLLTRFLTQDAKVSTEAYQVFIYISITMQMFEYLTQATANKKDDLSHMNSALGALQRSGPSSLKSSAGLQKMFCALRGTAVFAAIEQRKRTFLSEPDWLTIPFENFDKSTRDKLLDLGVHIPGILQDSNIFSVGFTSNCTFEYFEDGINLLVQVSELQEKLKTWFRALELKTSEPLYWSRTSPMTHGSNYQDMECIPKYSNNFHRLCFVSGPIAGLLVLYWSYCLQLSMTTIELQALLAQSLNRSPEQGLAQKTLSRNVEQERKSADDTAQLILEAEPYLSSCFEGLVCLQSPLKILAAYVKTTKGAEVGDAAYASHSSSSTPGRE